MNRTIALLLVGAILALPADAGTRYAEPAANIERAVLEALGLENPAQAQIGLDRTVKMPRCQQMLKASPISAATVEVQCPGEGGWRLYVPVRVQRIEQVIVLAVALPANQPLKAEHLRLESRDISRLSLTPINDLDQAIGQQLKRPQMAGNLLTADLLESGQAVKRGDIVTLVAGRSGVDVRVGGRALGAADVGDMLAVENLSSRRVVQGRLTATGEVRVGQ